MTQKITICLMVVVILVLVVAPVMAHGDEEHPSDLERVVVGAGLILITLSAAFVYLSRGKTDYGPTRKHNPTQPETPEWDG